MEKSINFNNREKNLFPHKLKYVLRTMDLDDFLMEMERYIHYLMWITQNLTLLDY